MTVDEYLRRGHAFCEHLRRLDGDPRPVDLRREAFMAVGDPPGDGTSIAGRLLVVTGGFHSSALRTTALNEADIDRAMPPSPGDRRRRPWSAASR